MGSINKFSSYPTGGNTGTRNLKANELGELSRIVLVPHGFTFATTTAASLFANWVTATKAVYGSRMYPLAVFKTLKDSSTKENYIKTPLGSIFGAKSIMMFDATVDINKASALEYRGALNGRNFDAFLIDINGNIAGYSPDGVKVQGMSLQLFRVEDQIFPSTGDLVSTPLKFGFMDSKQWNNHGVVINPLNAANGWNPNTDLEGIYSVDVAATNGTTTGVTATVVFGSTAVGDIDANINGLVVADFILKEGGVTKTITSVSQNVDGSYAIVATLATGSCTLDLVAPASISLTAFGIESTGAATFTV